jgi:hypothetical protein
MKHRNNFREITQHYISTELIPTNHATFHAMFQEVLDHAKASAALNRLAFKIKRLSFLPKENLHNICSYQELITK